VTPVSHIFELVFPDGKRTTIKLWRTTWSDFRLPWQRVWDYRPDVPKGCIRGKA